MGVDDRIARMHAELTGWRRDIHAHPELGFEENRTAGLVAERRASQVAASRGQPAGASAVKRGTIAERL